MNGRNVRATFDFAQLMIDVAMIFVSYFVAGWAYSFYSGDLDSLWEYRWMLLVYTVLFVLIMHLGRMYDTTLFKYYDRILKRIAASLIGTGFVVATLIFLVQFKTASRLFIALLFVISFFLIAAVRILFSEEILRKQARYAPRVLFVGDTKSAYNGCNWGLEELKGEELFGRYQRYARLSGAKNEFVAGLTFEDERIVSPALFEQYLVAEKIDEVVFLYRRNDDFPVEAYMGICEDLGITVKLLLDVPQLHISKAYVQAIGTFPVMTYHSVPVDRFQLCMKYACDIILSIIALVILSPVFLVTAVAIKLESPGPVFFRQKRVGVNGREFEILKFRSMYNDAEARKKDLADQNEFGDGALMFKIKDDPRVTRVGAFIRKYSIDELPQLINVLKRDMSLVGTRPPTVDEAEHYSRDQRRRISIRPGITGMWQVYGRSNIKDFATVVALDTDYIDNWTFGLDIELIMRTIRVVLGKRGAC